MVDAKARWLGHTLHAEVVIAVNDNLSLSAANAIATTLRGELQAHIPSLQVTNVRFATKGSTVLAMTSNGGLPTHQPAPEPVQVRGALAQGTLAIIDTHEGERLRLVASEHAPDLCITVRIARGGPLAAAGERG